MSSKFIGILIVIFSLLVGIYLGKNLENIVEKATITIAKIILKLKEIFWIKSIFDFFYVMTKHVLIPMIIIAIIACLFGYIIKMFV